MKTDNLKVGEVIKNYKELCELLEIKPKTSNSKKAQMKEIGRYVLLDKQGHKFIVKEIYEKPKPATSGSGNVFTGLIQLLIADHLAESKDQVVIITRSQLLRKINMVNHNYSFCNENVPRFSRYINIKEEYLYDFFNTTNSNYSAAIKTALNDLVKRSVIHYEWVHTICTKEGKHRVATDNEVEFILRCQKQLLIEMGYKRLNDVMFSRDWKNFKNTLQFNLQNDDEININYTYMSYRITSNRKYISSEQDDMLINYLEDADREGYKNELNGLLCARLLDNAIKRQSKARQGKSIANEKLKKLRSNFSLEKYTKQIIYYVIDGETDVNVQKEIRKQEEDKVTQAIENIFEGGQFDFDIE
ncbi:hypothetical protein JOC34_000850 [Virgibacillus halotolerans]|uniref:hypothetical protein n=1 Tax=Virgibacillus halotolerans TaxID=1071053 RepID=UPI0019613F65|nr:hypothetical protein [Virgibacillus halotolerans]MBM7598493.1 hypothetical protein [Virgibacillus halotolerans]